MVPSPGGAAAVNCLIEALLSGLRSDCSGAKVKRRPAAVGAAVVAALSDTGGGGGGAAPAGSSGGAIGEIEAVSGTFSGRFGCGVGAAGVAVGGADVGATRVTTAGAWDATRGTRFGTARSGSACSACRSIVTCASTGVAAVNNTALRIGNGRMQ